MSRDLRLLSGAVFGLSVGLFLVGLPLGLFGGIAGVALASGGPASTGPVSRDARIVAGALLGATVGVWIGGPTGAVILGVIGMLIGGKES